MYRDCLESYKLIKYRGHGWLLLKPFVIYILLLSAHSAEQWM